MKKTKDKIPTWGQKTFYGFVPPFNKTEVKKLLKAIQNAMEESINKFPKQKEGKTVFTFTNENGKRFTVEINELYDIMDESTVEILFEWLKENGLEHLIKQVKE